MDFQRENDDDNPYRILTAICTLATTHDQSVGALCRANDGFIVAQEGRYRPAQVENKNWEIA